MRGRERGREGEREKDVGSGVYRLIYISIDQWTWKQEHLVQCAI